MERQKYFKTYEELATLLIDRGLQVVDQETLCEYLTKNSYYRLVVIFVSFRWTFGIEKIIELRARVAFAHQAGKILGEKSF